MDEAGYGPNFGPLVVAATAWHVQRRPGEVASAGWGWQKSPQIQGEFECHAPSSKLRRQPTADSPTADSIDLYRSLRTIVSKTASDRRIAIADSKSLYTPGLGLRQLERGLHSVLRSMRQVLSCWSELIEYCAADPDGHHKRTCWPDDHNCALADRRRPRRTFASRTAFHPRLRIGPSPPTIHPRTPRLSRRVQRPRRPLRHKRRRTLAHHRRSPPRSHRQGYERSQPAPSPQHTSSATNTAAATSTPPCCSIIFPNTGSNPSTKATPKVATNGARRNRESASASACKASASCRPPWHR